MRNGALCVFSGGLFLLDSSAVQTVRTTNKNDVLHISSMPMETWIQPSVGKGNSETYPQMVGRRKHFSISFVSVLQHRSISSNHIRKMIPNPSYISPNMPTSQDSVCSCLDVDKDNVRLVGADNTRDGLGISTILLIFVCLGPGHSRHCAH